MLECSKNNSINQNSRPFDDTSSYSTISFFDLSNFNLENIRNDRTTFFMYTSKTIRCDKTKYLFLWKHKKEILTPP